MASGSAPGPEKMPVDGNDHCPAPVKECEWCLREKCPAYLKTPILCPDVKNLIDGGKMILTDDGLLCSRTGIIFGSGSLQPSFEGKTVLGCWYEVLGNEKSRGTLNRCGAVVNGAWHPWTAETGTKKDKLNSGIRTELQTHHRLPGTVFNRMLNLPQARERQKRETHWTIDREYNSRRALMKVSGNIP